MTNTTPDWMNWLGDREPEPDPAPVVSLSTRTSPATTEVEQPQPVPAPTPAAAVLVVGAGGGAGATTTALGLAGAWALRSGTCVTVDATLGGGDLFGRGANTQGEQVGVDDVLTVDTDDVGSVCASATTSGAGVTLVARGAGEVDLHRVDDVLRRHVDTVVYDLGAYTFSRDEAAGLRRAGSVVIVLVVQARADAFNRLRTYLAAVRELAGPAALDRTMVVVSHQNSAEPDVDPDRLRGYLDGRVHGVEEVPFDPHLGLGSAITPADLRAATVEAYDRIRTAVDEAGERQ